MPARVMLLALAIAVCALLLLPTPVMQQVTTVDPGDITTPTPTVAALLHDILPTPTPTPIGSRGLSVEQSQAQKDGYIVQPGDTLWRVAVEIGVDLDEVPCMVRPDFQPYEALIVGERLEFLPPGWQCHTILEGETPARIAAEYGITPQQILDVPWNHLGRVGAGNQPYRVQEESLVLTPGTYLRIPTGAGSTWQPPSLLATERVPGAPTESDSFLGFMLAQPLSMAPARAYAVGGPRAELTGPVPRDWPYGSGNFTWPVYGWLSQGYRGDHRAIDIAAPAGTFVTAADRGVVIRSGWNNQGYGMFVVIDHNIDYVTLYSHLQDVFVREGEVVGQGQVIGTVGSTGNSTGPHLHFEVRDFGRRTNPLGLLVR
jgi:murein DD-endopeptidase MepM/ murein hydrolase activator NlpD